jgi:hypothetical protein
VRWVVITACDDRERCMYRELVYQWTAVSPLQPSLLTSVDEQAPPPAQASQPASSSRELHQGGDALLCSLQLQHLCSAHHDHGADVVQGGPETHVCCTTMSTEIVGCVNQWSSGADQGLL